MKQLIISIFAALAAAFSASTATVTLDGVEYTLRNGTYTVSGWDEDNPNPKIRQIFRDFYLFFIRKFSNFFPPINACDIKIRLVFLFYS